MQNSVQVWFPKQGVTVSLEGTPEDLSQEVTYTGTIPYGVRMFDPVVLQLNEFTTQWMGVQTSPEDHSLGKLVAKVSLVRDRREVATFQGDVEKALLAFVGTKFPPADYASKVTRETHPLRDVVVTLRGPTRSLVFAGSKNRIQQPYLSKVMPDVRTKKDYLHPYVNCIKVRSLTDGGVGGALYEIRANIV